MKLIDFIKEDNPRALFPLQSSITLIEKGESELRDYVYKEIFDNTKKYASFLRSPIVHALKDKCHVRKTLLLDPVSLFYIYDFVHQNQKSFQETPPSDRRYYGYKFVNKKPINSNKEYHVFRKEKYDIKKEYRYFTKVDIQNCFNSFYHHDVVSHLKNEVPEKDAMQFGQFLSEGNGGRSINCFPQGIYPAKAIGNNYLKFIEESREISCPRIIRFLDDIFLFSNNITALEQDVIKLQVILGEYALSLNEEKTRFGSKQNDFDERKLDKIKKTLLQKREEIRSYDEDEEEVKLEQKEVEYLKELIKNKDVSEEDIELALSLLSEDNDESLNLTDLVLFGHPSLVKNLYVYISDINDEGAIWDSLNKKIRSKYLQEYELFWITKILIDHYEFDAEVASLLLEIFNHPSATTVIKSVILEVENNNFGLFELKEQFLRSSPSGITAACAMVGLINLEKGKRNQLYKYAGKASPFMHLIAQICSKI